MADPFGRFVADLGPAIENPNMRAQMEKISASRPGASPFEQYNATFPSSWGQFLENVAQQFPTSDPHSVQAAAQQLAMSIGPGAIAYHGSPHSFSAFNTSKIGTGEGAQAYGHGLYFAENPTVAQGYRTKLSDSPIDKVKADVYDIAGDRNWKITAWGPDGQKVPVSNQFLADHELKTWLGEDAAQKIIRGGDGVYNKLGIVPGNLYKVDIPDAQIAKMLDWDKPLSKQSPEARILLIDAMKKRGLPLGENGIPLWVERDPTGEAIHAALNPAQGSQTAAQQSAADLLRSVGIPGIRYLDQASRAGGKGTSNYVVFDDTLPKIVGKE